MNKQGQAIFSCRHLFWHVFRCIFDRVNSMYIKCIVSLIVSEDFVLRKAVAFSLNDLDACVECADTVGAMLVLHRESPFDLVIVMGTAAEMCRQEVMDTLRADKTRRTRVFVISWPQSEQMVRSMYRMGVNQYMTLPVSLHRLRRKVINELIDREKWK